MRTAILIVLLASSSGVYRWTDERGGVHFSDRPAAPAAEEVDPGTLRPNVAQPPPGELERRPDPPVHRRASPPPDDEACGKIKAAIDRVHSLMRAGYKVPQGERYRARLHELRRRQMETCNS